MKADGRVHDLLAAVDELTLPKRMREEQDVLHGPSGRVIGTARVTVVHAPLLSQLEAAITGAVGSGSSTANLAFERNPIDTAALYKFMQIEQQIRGWLVAYKLRPSKHDAAANLRAWYAATRGKNLDAGKERFYTDLLWGWVREIRAHLDPPKEWELPDQACPLCGAVEWTNTDGTTLKHPLVVRYKPVGPDTIQRARGVCRACQAVWPVRQLSWEIEQREGRE